MIAPTRAEVDFVREYVAAAGRFALTTAQRDMRARVPACPGWTVYDLVVHLGNVHSWAATVVETGQRAVEPDERPRSHRSRAMSTWYAGHAEDLYAVLRSSDSSAPCWNFVTGEGHASFWSRRQLHETTLHLVDLDQCVGRPTDIPARVAVDGVDEVLRTMVERMHRRGHRVALTRPLSLVASDTGHVWTLHPRAEAPPAVVDESEDGADRVSAPADVLLTVLWKRRAPTDPQLELHGDGVRIGAFLGSQLVP